MSRRSSLFSLLLVPPLAALLASPILRHQAQAETAGTPLARPAGYTPDKALVKAALDRLLPTELAQLADKEEDRPTLEPGSSATPSRAAELLAEGVSGAMVAVRGDRCEPVPLDRVAGFKKVIPLDHPWLQTARLVETCLGDG